jgi:hypothetical protein
LAACALTVKVLAGMTANAPKTTFGRNQRVCLMGRVTTTSAPIREVGWDQRGSESDSADPVGSNIDEK